MASAYLLDTHAAIWATEGKSLSKAAIAILSDAGSGANEIMVSPITAWEVGLLVAKGRLAMHSKPLTWFKTLCQQTGVVLADLTADVLIESSSLPGTVHGDPADRILIATARAQGLTILTRDRKILTYAEKGHVMAVEC